MEDVFFTDRELVRIPPTKRAAYSDRTAWILAEISRLVYQPLPAEMSVRSLVEAIMDAVARGEHADTVEALVTRAREVGVETGDSVADILRAASFELVQAFAVEGTEALLARLPPHAGFEGMLVLAFRGTEQDRLEDILTDARANLVPSPGGGRVHKGFLEAFRRVEQPIRAALEENKGPPVYITGHSLGGALALMATRYLGSDSTGATYTYGCPRAADDTFFRPIKTPVYRIVNAADGVARLPFGYMLSIVLSLIRLIPINGTRTLSEWLRRHFLGYTHHGSLIFLSAPPNEVDEHGVGFKGLIVRKSPDIFWRISLVLRRWIGTFGRAAITDHGMEGYCMKLLAYAQRRNRK
jgi:hypothetical protein